MTLTQWTDPNPPPTKACYICSEVYPRSADNFYETKNTPDGLTWGCKRCLNKKGVTEPGLMLMRSK